MCRLIYLMVGRGDGSEGCGGCSCRVALRRVQIRRWSAKHEGKADAKRKLRRVVGACQLRV